MRVGMPGRPGMQPGAGRVVGDDLLRVARHRVVFRICAEHRAGFAPARGEGGRHLAGTFFDRKPFRPKEVAIGSRRFVLAPGRFGVVPDAQMKIGEAPCLLVDPLERVTLRAGHRHHRGLLVGWLLQRQAWAEDFPKGSGGWVGADWVAYFELRPRPGATTAVAPPEICASSAEGARPRQMHRYGNVFRSVDAHFRKSMLTRIWRKIPAASQATS